jgi:hypothetical protein
MGNDRTVGFTSKKHGISSKSLGSWESGARPLGVSARSEMLNLMSMATKRRGDKRRGE